MLLRPSAALLPVRPVELEIAMKLLWEKHGKNDRTWMTVDQKKEIPLGILLQVFFRKEKSGKNHGTYIYIIYCSWQNDVEMRF